MVLWIFAGIFLILALLSRLWLGIQIQGAGGEWQVRARVGPLRFQLYPPKAAKLAEHRAEKPVQPNGTSAAGAKKQGTFPKVTPQLLRSAYRELWPPLRKALSRLGRSVRVDPLEVSVTIGAAGDPPEGAELYGLAQGAVWAGMPVLEQLLDIPDPHIHIGIDFNTSGPRLRLSTQVRVRLGALAAIALGIGAPALRWYQNTLSHERSPAEQTAAA